MFFICSYGGEVLVRFLELARASLREVAALQALTWTAPRHEGSSVQPANLQIRSEAFERYRVEAKFWEAIGRKLIVFGKFWKIRRNVSEASGSFPKEMTGLPASGHAIGATIPVDRNVL